MLIERGRVRRSGRIEPSRFDAGFGYRSSLMLLQLESFCLNGKLVRRKDAHAAFANVMSGGGSLGLAVMAGSRMTRLFRLNFSLVMRTCTGSYGRDKDREHREDADCISLKSDRCCLHKLKPETEAIIRFSSRFLNSRAYLLLPDLFAVP